MKTDIQIAQEAKLQPIREVAASLGISEDDLELYGKYKAKLSSGFMNEIKDREDGKLVLVTAINPTPAGEGKNYDQHWSRTGTHKAREENGGCVKRTFSRTVLRDQRRCCRRRICPGGADGRLKSSLYR